MSHLLPEQTLGCIATDYVALHRLIDHLGQLIITGRVMHSKYSVSGSGGKPSTPLSTPGPDSSSRPALPSRQDRLSLRTNGRKRRGDISQSPGNICLLSVASTISRNGLGSSSNTRGSAHLFAIRIPLRSTSVLARTQVQCLKGRRTMGGYHQIHFWDSSISAM